MKKTIGFLFSCFLIFTLAGHADALPTDERTTENALKPWTITLSSAADRASVNNSTIFIQTSNGTVHPSTVSISTDGAIIEVKPQQTYVPGVQYTLSVTKAVKSAKGMHLKKDSLVSFTYEGKAFTDIKGIVNPLFTNVTAAVKPGVVRVELTDQTGTSRDMHPTATNSYSLGLLGMASGDKLRLKAYDRNGIVLEELTYELAN